MTAVTYEGSKIESKDMGAEFKGMVGMFYYCYQVDRIKERSPLEIETTGKMYKTLYGFGGAILTSPCNSRALQPYNLLYVPV